MHTPCGWEADVCKDCCTDALDALDPTVVATLEATAVGILWAATGKQYGLCETVLRPCRRECGSFWGGLPFPTRISGDWVNLTCGSCVSRCGCSTISEFLADDIDSVVAANVDGEDIDPSDVLVYDRRRVVRADGGTWPACQDLASPDGEPGTWSVTVLQGRPVPAGGEVMAGILLCELAKACTGDEGCRLPKRVQSVTRQGVSINFADAWESIGLMRTGIFEVDLWIESARSTGYRGATVSSIDVPRPSVLTWPTGESS